MHRHDEAIRIIMDNVYLVKSNLIASLEDGEREEQKQYELLRQYHSLMDSHNILMENREASEKGEK